MTRRPQSPSLQRKILLAAIAVTAVSVLSISCKKSSRRRAAVAATVVTVVSTQPASGSTGVARDADVVVTFSLAIREDSVDATSFRVVGSISGPVPGTITFSADGTAVRFRPGALYAFGERIRVSLGAAITSTSGAQTQAHEIEFVTLSAPGPGVITPATVTSTVPTAHAVDVPLDATIEIGFSEPLDPATVTSDHIVVEGERSGRVTVRTVLGDANRLLRLTPLRAYFPGEIVRIRLSRGLRDIDGDAIAGHVLAFSATSRAPSPDASGVDVAIPTDGRADEVRAADIDGDGRPELLTRSENRTSIVVWSTVEGPTLESVLTIELDSIVHAFAVADVDEDGALDLLAARGLEIVVLRNTSTLGAPSFEVTATRTIKSITRSLVVADLDHEGELDWILDTDRGIEVILAGTAAPSRVLGSQRLSRTQLVLTDLNADGHLDLIHGDPRFSGLSVRLQTAEGRGDFRDAIEIPTAGAVEDVLVADVDHDGELEIIALLALPGDAAEAITIIEELPRVDDPSQAVIEADGSLLDEGRVALGDLDGDGRIDAVRTASSEDLVLLYSSLDTLTLTSTTLASARQPLSVTLVDLDGDLALDVVVGAIDELRVRFTNGSVSPPVGSDPVFRASSVEVTQGDTARSARLALDSAVASEALSLVLRVDPDVARELRFDGTGGVLASAELLDARRVDDSTLVVQAIADFLFPIVGGTLPAGSDLELGHLVFDVPADAPVGTSSIDWIESAGEPPVSNSLVVEGERLAAQTVSGTITVQEGTPTPRDATLRVERVLAVPASQVLVPVRASTTRPIEAYSVAIAHPTELEVVDLSLEGTDTELFGAEFVVPTLGEGFVALTVFFELVPPFDSKAIPVGDDAHLFSIVARIAGDQPLGTIPLTPRDGLGDPAIDNVFIDNSEPFHPSLEAGHITVVDSISRFVRGDVNQDGRIDLNDAAMVLSFIFGAGPAPRCADAADANDDGLINVTDSTRILEYAVRGGVPPAAPFPEPGVDPTDNDPLDCAEGI